MQGASGPTPEIQFEHAEYAVPAAAVCVACKQPIANTYYQVNGKLLCASCREKLAAGQTQGSAVGRVLAAGGLAVLAGLLGTIIYFAVEAISGYQIGLIALLVGFLVGGAVRYGSGRRGGWFYQALAIVVTYLSIGTSDCLSLFREIAKDPERFKAEMHKKFEGHQPVETSQPAATTEENALAGSQGAAESQPAREPTSNSAIRADEDDEFKRTAKDHPALLLVSAVLLLGFLIVSTPIFIGMGSPINFLLVAVALYEAWKMNKRIRLVITGPQALAQAPSPGVPPAGIS